MSEIYLESQVISQTIVRCSQDLRSQLSHERDSVRHISLQKDIEVKDLQTRLEKSVSISFSSHLHATNHILDRGTGQDTRDTRRC